MDTTQMINTRITLKIDTLANWEAIKDTFKPLEGEVCIAKIEGIDPANKKLEPIMFKVGAKDADGNLKTWGELDWASAKAADVYAWAKQSAIFVDKEGTGNVVASIEWDASLNNGKGGIKYKTASVATSEGLKAVQEAITNINNAIDAMYSNDEIDAAIKVVADDLAEHEEAFAEFQTTTTQAIADAKSGAEQTAANALADYVATNDAALAEVKATAEAATTVSEVDAQIDTKIAALNLGTTYEPIGAEKNAKDYADAEIDKVEEALGKVVDGTTPVAKATEAGKVTNALTVGNKTFDGSAAVAVTAADLGLESAMHFVGALSAAPDSAVNGDVYLNTATKKEYVYSNGEWHELGDEGSYALRTVTITGADGLVGGGDLTANRTIGLSDTTKASLALANSAIQEDDLNLALAELTKDYGTIITYDVEDILGNVEAPDSQDSTILGNRMAISNLELNVGNIEDLTNLLTNRSSIVEAINDLTGNIFSISPAIEHFEQRLQVIEGTEEGSISKAEQNAKDYADGLNTAMDDRVSALEDGTSIYNVDEVQETVTGAVKYLVFNCGSATTLID